MTTLNISKGVGIVHSGYAKYCKELLRASVELYELNKRLWLP